MGAGGLSSDINFIPLIGVLLLLLIIFMVMVPVTPAGLDALVPQPLKTAAADIERIVARIESKRVALPHPSR